MLELTTMNNVFYFDGQLYEQIDGLPMGGPASCVYANAFMCFHEERWLDECPVEFRPLFYKRYLDDCVVIFRKEEDADLFETYINNKHSNIKFTKEVESDKSLNFLDLTLKHEGGIITTQTYRKPTHTGQGTNFSSFIDHIFKINAIKTLLHRAYSTCSSWTDLHDEITYLISYFSMNRYPKDLVHNQIRYFLDGVMNPIKKPSTAHKKRIYVKFSSYPLLVRQLKYCH